MAVFFLPPSIILVTVGFRFYTLAVLFSILPSARVGISVSIDSYAWTAWFALKPIAMVFVSVIEGELSLLLAIIRDSTDERGHNRIVQVALIPPAFILRSVR